MNTNIDQITKRNRKVELDKAWETSWVRKASIAAITYGFAVLFLYTIDAPNYWLAALVPTVGYLFSTLTLKPLKAWWIKRQG